MKLCRFELQTHPGEPRSGVYYDHRVYETDGENAIGIHELGSVRFLPPIGLPPALRAFDTYLPGDGSSQLTYAYLNPSGLRGANSDLVLPVAPAGFDVEARIAMIVAETGESIEPGEAAGFILGFSPMLVFKAADLEEEERLHGLPPGPSRDVGTALGPFLVTPEELVEHLVESPATYRWRARMTVNDTEIFAVETVPAHGFDAMLAFASRFRAAVSGEVMAAPPLSSMGVESSPLGRSLLAGDRVALHIDSLETLVVRFA